MFFIMPRRQRTIKVFICYAHEDESLLRQLETHLSSLKRQGIISTWYDREIVPGTNWAQEIDKRLSLASIILLLVSADFLASDYCYHIEMKRALKRHQAGKARVIPILMRPVDWQDTPFAHLQALPTDARPITTWSNQDEACLDVVSGIRFAIEDLSLQPASPSRAALPSIWNIPYPRNPFFMGRESLLVKLHTQLQTGQATELSQSPYAISGLGGIGKTHIAIEYAYRYYQDYEAILWARAENQEALISSYITIAALLQLPECQEQKQEIIIEAVKMWLQNQSKWLLILDNADNLDVLPPFLPTVPGGHILITTRASSMQRLATRLEVETFSDEQGAMFLLRRAGLLTPKGKLSQASIEDRKFATQLTQEMGGLPLALDQAGAYLEATGMSLKEYLELYRTHRKELLQERRSLIRDHPDAVATTWSLSFQRVQEKNPAAADLLRLCAYLAPDAIPEEVLTADASALGPVLAPIASDALRRNQAIEALRAYSLVRRDPRGKTLSVHRLVQAVIQDTLPPEEQMAWMRRAVRRFETAFPNDPQDVSQWNLCERWLSHALICTVWIEQVHMESAEAGGLLYRTASYLSQRARYAEAEPLYLRALQILEQRSGSEHPDITYPLNGLANVYRVQGRYAEAEPLYLRALRIREQQLGPEHPDVATLLNNLAILYQTQDKIAEAEPLYLRALQILELQLGPENSLTAYLLNNLANLYLDQGKYTEAEPLYLRALRIREQQLGLEHPHVVYPLHGLANFYLDQGKYAEAEPLYLRALRIREQQLGPEHLDVAYLLSDLGDLYRKQSKYAEAEPLLLRALRIREQQLGPEHLNVAESLSNLGDLCREQGKYARAEALYRRALRILLQCFGPEHRYVAELLTGLGDLYGEQGKYGEAESLYLRAIHILEQQLELNHPDVAHPLNGLASLYFQQGKYADAEPLFKRALVIREKALGPDHPDTKTSMKNLAAFYEKQRNEEPPTNDET